MRVVASVAGPVKALASHIQRAELTQHRAKFADETGKELDRLLTQAADNAVRLFFNEADALLGKHTAVSDSHDRFGSTEPSAPVRQMAARVVPKARAERPRNVPRVIAGKLNHPQKRRGSM